MLSCHLTGLGNDAIQMILQNLHIRNAIQKESVCPLSEAECVFSYNVLRLIGIFLLFSWV